MKKWLIRSFMQGTLRLEGESLAGLVPAHER
jgi:hypothetical protein